MHTLIELQAQIKALEKQADEIKKRKFDTTVRQIRLQMQAFGITFKDLQTHSAKGTHKHIQTKARKNAIANGSVMAKRIPSKAPLAPKYRGPHGETWSGRGRTPRWLSAADRLGRTRDEFRVASNGTEPHRESTSPQHKAAP